MTDAATTSRIEAALFKAQCFCGSVHYNGRALQHGEVLSFNYADCAPIVEGVRSSHVQGPLRLRTKEPCDMKETKDVRIRFTCSSNRGHTAAPDVESKTQGISSPAAEGKTHECTTCGKHLSSSSALTRHRLVHEENNKKHTCPKCKAGFLHKYTLTRHQPKCQGIKSKPKQQLKHAQQQRKKRKKKNKIVNEEETRVNSTRSIVHTIISKDSSATGCT